MTQMIVTLISVVRRRTKKWEQQGCEGISEGVEKRPLVIRMISSRRLCASVLEKLQSRHQKSAETTQAAIQILASCGSDTEWDIVDEG